MEERSLLLFQDHYFKTPYSISPTSSRNHYQPSPLVNILARKPLQTLTDPPEQDQVQDDDDEKDLGQEEEDFPRPLPNVRQGQESGVVVYDKDRASHSFEPKQQRILAREAIPRPMRLIQGYGTLRPWQKMFNQEKHLRERGFHKE